ncbi:tRNA (adenosine(37)-N6)-threonylcarbamoyltransferase complex ATPase subunit type 1 TsaE [Halolactibacillus alkaliphilus]|uniref:tRNA threonylcarbamoyladenosine biosynthesis protein TsaE n=1 Tax=Halolactibacillus alkaliphilus TaxID=442899 RepID=A0A511X494_9BACI|nr:tRNA (adenosine(37)-N6)-threonylcarbamoyltransferase complex ATPase subunit type 1 TsaE [Halolactibacillus alkaliphilus]GEN57751.1 tRNA (adenosine(37)-N6)-threonylcarbamoyltransferase complex ATPase subunit type 1 TsaE [Halolactibacillus alkaliphilus]GGN74993.1 tRNA (adenosine(37)-N6)-threonylcarbamoyltransferase complex ATPase subunit type 1 TsaE [Halolactibacillus alkaliphilus]SFP03886.1 tRNA threonylcarbamoyladenosine biosynthesis protein TsaE [Halolactibacillus alkaliphilus]
MTEKTYHVYTADETKRLAEKIAKLLRRNDCLTLSGDLGAGKTTFTKGLGIGLGVKRTINSPTFTIVKVYQGEKPLYHIDAYRLEDEEEDIGFDDYFYGDGVTVVEWPQFIQSFLPKERLDIVIKKIDDSDERLITLKAIGKYFDYVIKEIPHV